MREINELPSDIVVVQKVLKILPAKFETFVRVLRSEDTPILANLASRLHMEEMTINPGKEQNGEALVLNFSKNGLLIMAHEGTFQEIRMYFQICNYRLNIVQRPRRMANRTM